MAIRRVSMDETLVHDVHSTIFQKEVLAALEAKHGENSFEIVRWYKDHDDPMNASDYTNKNIKKWSDKELVAVISELKLCPGGLLREFERRDKLLTAVDLFLREEQGYLSNAVIASDAALSTPAKVERYGDELLTTWKNANTAHTRKALAECKASKISAFLRLFDDPSKASRTRAEECLKLFGEKVIQKAVFGSRMYKTEDIKSVLTRFSKSFNSLCPKELIKLFHDFGGGLASVREFVHANLRVDERRALRHDPQRHITSFSRSY